MLPHLLDGTCCPFPIPIRFLVNLKYTSYMMISVRCCRGGGETWAETEGN